jgi:hypothetical protein
MQFKMFAKTTDGIPVWVPLNVYGAAGLKERNLVVLNFGCKTTAAANL